MKTIQNQLFSFAAVVLFTATCIFGMNIIDAASGVTLGMALTTGFTKICGARSGGAVKAYLVDAADLTSFTLNGGTGAYSAVTMVTNKVFYKFEFEQDSAFFKWSASMENGSLKITKLVEFYLGFITQTHRNRLQDIANSSACGMIVIVEDSNAQKWVYGYTEKFLKERPMKLKTGESDSGKAFTDANGSVVTLEVMDNEYPREFTGTVPV